MTDGAEPPGRFVGDGALEATYRPRRLTWVILALAVTLGGAVMISLVEEGAPVGAIVMIGVASVGPVVFLAMSLRRRLEVGDDAIVIRNLSGTARIPWDDIARFWVSDDPAPMQHLRSIPGQHCAAVDTVDGRTIGIEVLERSRWDRSSHRDFDTPTDLAVSLLNRKLWRMTGRSAVP